MGFTHIFAGNPLDRADRHRRDPAWLEAAARADNARYLPLWQLNVLVDHQDERGSRLGWLSHQDLSRLEVKVPPIFLGLHDDTPHFALDISSVHDPEHELNLGDELEFEESRAAAMHLPLADTGIVAQARAQAGWHRSHRFCSVCGQPTEQEKGGHLRRCPSCGAEHFPRTDPVAIMLVEDGDHCLLGQSHGPLVRFGMYSALAGFIDQGESIEEAVLREIREEAGIEAESVRYHSSQPWPFPSSLMVGCHATAVTRDIVMDEEEMHDVRWFHRAEILQALDEEHPTLRLPGPMAIAHHLIRDWAERT